MKKIAHASESIIRIAAILFFSMPAFGTPERQSGDERAAPPPVNAMITHITFDLPQNAAPPIGNPTIPDETDRLLAECWNLVETGMAGVEDSSRSLAILDSSHSILPILSPRTNRTTRLPSPPGSPQRNPGRAPWLSIHRGCPPATSRNPEFPCSWEPARRPIPEACLTMRRAGWCS